MKIAVGTDDKKTFRKGHFGQSRYYLIFEILNGEIVSEEIRENPYVGEDEKHDHHGEAERIMDLLKDCGLFMARGMGLKSVKKISEQNIDCIITKKIDDIRTAVTRYLDGDDEDFEYFDVDQKSFAPCSVRTGNK